MHEKVFKKSMHSPSEIINTWTACPLKTVVMLLTKTNVLILHAVMYFLKVKFFIVGIWVGHRIRHAKLYLLAENWLLLLTNLLFNDSASMLVFIVMNTRLLIRWSDKCAICLENYAVLKVFSWRIRKGKKYYKMLAFRGKRDRKSEGTTPLYFASVVYMQIFGQNSCLCLAESKFKVCFFFLFHWRWKELESNGLCNRRVVLELWKTGVKSDGCSLLVLWWHANLPS